MEDPADKLVEMFYEDLSAAVRQASSGEGIVSGFFDQKIPLASDWKRFITRALSTAQVFVPLYSVGYLTNSWSGRELACFRARVTEAGWGNPVRRLVPVLWAPLAGVQEPPGLRAALVPGKTDPDYADNGLLVLLKRRLYHHDLYQTVVNRLAAQIVELAEQDPMEPVDPSKVGDIEEAASAFPASRPLPVFVIEVAAPTAGGVPENHDSRPYGTAAEQWRPFPGQELPLAEYARQLTERFDFNVQVGAVSRNADPAARRPGIIVIDPVFIASETGRTTLEAVARTLPKWVLPLVVVASDDERTRELAAGVLDILAKAKTLPNEWASHPARNVTSLNKFVSVVPVLVAEAERQYFRRVRPHPRPSQTAQRPRLARPEEPEGPAASDP
jgi:FxsC-like protein